MNTTFSGIRLVLCALIAVTIATTVAVAETKPEYRYNSGACDDGKQWWSVAIYYDGVLTMIEGINCDGDFYRRWQCPPTILANDPTAGLAPTHTGDCAPGQWRSIIMWNDRGEPVSVDGVNCAGQGYTLRCAAEPGP